MAGIGARAGQVIGAAINGGGGIGARGGAIVGAGIAAARFDPPAVGFVSLADVDSTTRVTAELIGDIQPSGYPAHEVVALLGRPGRANFDDRPPLQLKLPLLIETWDEGTVVPVMRAINQLYGIPRTPQQSRTPATLRFLGIGVDWAEPALNGWRWALTGDPEWGQTRGESQATQYAEVGLTIVELDPTSPGAVTEVKGRTIRVTKTGPNTLDELARHYKTTWYRLVTLNPKLPADRLKAIKPNTRVVIG